MGTSIILTLILLSAFSDVQSQSSKIGQKVEQLLQLQASRPVIRLDNAKFMDLVKESPKNYSVIVMFTALKPARGCQICKQASDEYHILANSYWSSPERSSSLFFAMVDFDEGNEAFSTMKLNTAPVFMHFPAKGKPKKQDTFEIHRYGLEAEVMSKFVNEKTGVHIRIFRPPNYLMNVMLLCALGLLVGLAYIKRDSFEFLFQRNTWAGITIAFILVMMSGQMWNQIRGAGFAHKNPRTGEVSYIHGSSQGQFIAESYIVMALHGAIALGVILMNEACTMPEINESGRKGLLSWIPYYVSMLIHPDVMAATGLGLVTVFFSLILSIFRSKYGGYPYRFLF